MNPCVYPAAFFAAANTTDGFVSLFASVFSSKQLHKIWIVKGTPGSGKSTFFNRCACACESKGVYVQRIYCSADPSSLDGIIVPQAGVAMLDGTAPHTTDPTYPGTVERVINFFNFIDCDALEKEKEKLVALLEEKSAAFTTAYHFLNACAPLYAVRMNILRAAFDTQKAQKCICTLLDKAPPICGKHDAFFFDAISCFGMHSLPLPQAPQHFTVESHLGLEMLFMEHLSNELNRRHIFHAKVHAVPFRQCFSALLCGNACYAACPKNGENHSCDVSRFLLPNMSKKSLRNALVPLLKEEKNLLDLATASFLCAGTVHDRVEALYHPYIHFDALNAFCDTFIKKTFLPAVFTSKSSDIINNL